MADKEKKPPCTENTDLDSIKDVMRSMLEKEVVAYPYNIDVIYHPFLDGELFLLRTPNEETYREIHILQDPDGLAEVKQWIRKRIDEMDSIDELLSLITKDYRLNFLVEIEDFLSDDDFPRILKEIWLALDASDYFTLENALCILPVVGMFNYCNHCNPIALMGERDYNYYRNLPEELTVYRAVVDTNDGDSIYGWSWTLNLDVAIRFATRYRNNYGKGGVFKAKINKEIVLAYFSDRNEETRPHKIPCKRQTLTV